MATKSKDYETLRERLECLDIRLYKDIDGSFTVISASEPLFCFQKQNLDEIQKAVSSTLEAYVKLFYHVSNVSVTTSEASEDLQNERPVPIKQLSPVSRLRSRLDSEKHQLAL
jgi:hypothetical protein